MALYSETIKYTATKFSMTVLWLEALLKTVREMTFTKGQGQRVKVKCKKNGIWIFSQRLFIRHTAIEFGMMVLCHEAFLRTIRKMTFTQDQGPRVKVKCPKMDFGIFLRDYYRYSHQIWHDGTLARGASKHS